MQISWSLLCCTILQAVYYVDILVITLLHNIVGSVLCRYLGHYFAAQYCRQSTMQISWSLLCCTYCRQSTMQISCQQRTMQMSLSLLCCTILQAAFYVDILFITLLHNIVCSVLSRYLGRYFAAQYCRQRTMQISWSLICCTILQAEYYVDILVITLPSQYCRQCTMQLYWSLFCCTILQAAFFVDILFITLLLLFALCISVVTLPHNSRQCTTQIYWSLLAAQYCRQRIMQISRSLLCCTILQTAYYVDILVITLLHNNVGSVLCRYLGYYFAAQYCRQRSMQISWSLLCCTILQAVYYVDIFVVSLLHNIVGSVLCRYLGHYFAAQLQAAYYVDILVITLPHNNVGSVLCRYLGLYFAALYCRQSTMYISCQQCNMQISWSLLCCTILQAAYYVDILFITFLHNIVCSVLCRYLGRYFAVQYCTQRICRYLGR